MTYRYQDNIQLTWMENRQRLALAVHQVAKRVLNEVLHEANKQFVEAASKGRVLSFDCTRADAEKRLRAATLRLTNDE